MSEDDIVEIGETADDGVLKNRVIDPGLFANGYIGTDYRVADITAGSDADRLDDDGVLELVLRGDSAAKLFQKLGIGFQQCFFFPAVEPVLHLEGPKLDTAADHAFDSIGEIVFPIAGDIITDVGFEAIEKYIRLF